jgi:hypothetical protein
MSQLDMNHLRMQMGRVMTHDLVPLLVMNAFDITKDMIEDQLATDLKDGQQPIIPSQDWFIEEVKKTVERLIIDSVGEVTEVHEADGKTALDSLVETLQREYKYVRYINAQRQY